MNATLPLSQQVFSILSTLIEERLGLYFGSDYRELLAERLAPRAIERGFDSMLDYYYFLRYDAAAEQEVLAIADVLTVNETYFLREATQVRVLVQQLLPPLIATGRRVRIWCAACSTGEEPLSLAALLDEQQLLGSVDILATDVSSRALDIASRGLYGKRAVRAFSELPPWLEQRGEQHAPHERLRGAIEWRQLNLLDERAVSELGAFDAILCRNVLIYFRDETIQSVVARLYRAIEPGGVLLVGASESLLRLGTSFSCEELGGAFFYRKVSA